MRGPAEHSMSPSDLAALRENFGLQQKRPPAVALGQVERLSGAGGLQ